jgi:hypothetical protein
MQEEGVFTGAHAVNPFGQGVTEFDLSFKAAQRVLFAGCILHN